MVSSARFGSSCHGTPVGVLWCALLGSAAFTLACTAPAPSAQVLGEQQRALRRAELTADLASYTGLGVTMLPGGLGESGGSTANVAAFTSRGTAIKDVILALFKDSDINVMIDGSVAGTATFDIKEASLEESFRVLLSTHDLDYEWDGSFLRVSPTARRTFDIDFPSLEGFGGGGGASAGEESGLASSDQLTETTSGGAASFWELIERNLETLSASDTSAHVVVNPRVGSISVEGQPSTVRRIAVFLDNARRQATRQVSLEARVLEVQLSNSFKAGVDFSLLPGFFNSANATQGTLAGGALVTQTAKAGVNALQVGYLNTGQFSAFVDALETQGQVRVLSSPRVSTLNNVPAVIRVVEQVPVIEREIIDTDSASRTEFNVRFEDAGVSVLVTPQIGEDGVITALVEPSIVEVSGYISTPDNLITEPILSTRTLRTMLRVPDGKPVVLGGLRSKRSSESLSKVPILGDLPLLGALFSKTTQDVADTELIIVLVPRILTPAWQREDYERGLDRVLRLRQPFRLSPIHARMSEHAGEWFDSQLGGEAAVSDAPDPGASGERAAKAAVPQRALSRAGLGRLALRRALASLERRDETQALSDLQEALGLSPRLPQAWLLSGILELRKGRVNAARSSYLRAIRLQKNDFFGRNNLGLLELRSGNAVAAEGLFSTAIEFADLPVLRNNLGIALLQQGRLSEAIAEFERASIGDPALPEAHVNLAVCYRQKGMREKAQAAWRAFLLCGGNPDDTRLAPMRELMREVAAPGR